MHARTLPKRKQTQAYKNVGFTICTSLCYSMLYNVHVQLCYLTLLCLSPSFISCTLFFGKETWLLVIGL